MKKLIILLFAVFNLCGASELRAQTNSDHLNPLEGIFNIYDFQFEYYSQIRKVLFDGLSDTPELRFQVLPSFSPESVLDIVHEREANKYFLIYHIGEKMIWSNKKWKDVRVIKFKKEIDKNSVESIKSLFQAAIAQTKYPEKESMGLDGANYIISVKKYGQRVGTVWSPPKGTKMSRLVDVGYTLIELASNKDTLVVFSENFIRDIEKLKSEIE